MSDRFVTLSQFVLQQERDHPEASGEFTGVLLDIALAAKMINKAVIRAGLVDVLGDTGVTNVQGERVQKLDVYAHSTIMRVLGSTGQLAVVASEEDEGIVPMPDDAPIGKYVVLNNVMFQTIGVMAARGAAAGGQDQDDVVMLPLTTGSLRLFGARFLRNVTVAVDDVDLIDATQDAVTTLLQQRHGVLDFQIRNMASIIETASETQNTLTVLLASVAAISLLVGGIGVMNIMLVSVTERTREIGIRMATGARMRNILQQFLTEALFVSVLGGAIGVVLGMLAALAINAFGTPIQFSLSPVLLAFGCALAIGLVFGYFPARKAAQVDPVVALGK